MDDGSCDTCSDSIGRLHSFKHFELILSGIPIESNMTMMTIGVPFCACFRKMEVGK